MKHLMKHPKSQTFYLISVFGLMLYCIGVAFPVNAAGSDTPKAPQNPEVARCIQENMVEKATDVIPPDVQQMCNQQYRTFNWQQWSQPYFQEESLCRDRSGSVVCFTPESAQKLRW